MECTRVAHEYKSVYSTSFVYYVFLQYPELLIRHLPHLLDADPIHVLIAPWTPLRIFTDKPLGVHLLRLSYHLVCLPPELCLLLSEHYICILALKSRFQLLGCPYSDRSEGILLGY